MKSNQPTTLIVYGANTVGLKLSELLTAQHSAVLVLDEFTKSARDTIKQLKAGHVEVYDLSAIPSLTQKIQRLDYICILLDQFLTGISAVPGKRFLEESNNIDAVLKLAIQQGSKVILTTSIELHRKIAEAAQRRIGDTLSTKKGDSFNHIELQRYAENLAAEYHDQTSLDIRIARIGELMGEGISLEAKSPFMQMLKESVTKPRIIIPGEGLDYSYYIHYLDAVYGIVKAIFSSKTNGEVFSLSFPDEISTLNLAYKILEFNPHAQEIAFGGAGYESPPHQVYVPAKNLSKIGWTPKIPFEKALHETLDFVHKQYNVTWKNKPEWKTFEDAQDSALKTGTPVHRAEIATPFGKLLSAFSAPIGRIKDKILESVTSLRKAGGQPRFTLKLLIGSALSMLVFLFIVSPLLQVLVGGVGAYHYGKKAAGQGLAMNSEDAQESLDNMSFYVDLVSSGWRGLKWADHIPPAHNFYSQTARIVLALEHLSTGSSFLVDGLDPYIRYVRDFQPITSFGSNAGGGSREYQNELEAIESTFPSIERANVEITLAREALVGIDRTVYPPSLVKYIDELTKRTDEAGEMLSILEQFGTFVPEILGKDERKTYIVLFQNPMELRSTGGWLTSVAKVGIEHGQIRELEVKDVYDIDSRIPETVQPPESLSEVLNVDSWTVSLSNWSPDFPQSAEAAEYLLQEAGTITNADGVIMVDLEFVRSLLDVWGTVSVAGETEPVTADNLYDKVVEIHREFTPGSTRKPVFLSNLANEIMRRILASPKDQWPQIASVIQQSLDERHLMLYLHNTNVQTVVQERGWGGHLENTRNPVFPVEWNWGANKANHFVDRSGSIQTSIQSEDQIKQSISLTYNNRSTENRYPEGDYVNFLRVYIPKGSTIIRIEGLSSVRSAYDETMGLHSVSGWITVPVNGSSSCSIEYAINRDSVEDFPLNLEAGGRISYHLSLIKQAGLQSDPWTIEITYPNGWEPIDLTNVHRELNALIQRTDLSVDRTIELMWER